MGKTFQQTNLYRHLYSLSLYIVFITKQYKILATKILNQQISTSSTVVNSHACGKPDCKEKGVHRCSACNIETYLAQYGREMIGKYIS